MTPHAQTLAEQAHQIQIRNCWSIYKLRSKRRTLLTQDTLKSDWSWKKNNKRRVNIFNICRTWIRQTADKMSSQETPSWRMRPSGSRCSLASLEIANDSLEDLELEQRILVLPRIQDIATKERQEEATEIQTTDMRTCVLYKLRVISVLRETHLSINKATFWVKPRKRENF